LIHVLALLGNAGHGKTSAANYLVDNFDAKIFPLAGPLKRAAKKIMRFTDAQIYGTQAEKEALDPRYGFSGREFCKRLGTEGLRDEFGDMIHLRRLAELLAKEDAETDFDRLYVVDDCRFRNEAEFFAFPELHDMHSAVIKIVATDVPVDQRHASEAEVLLVPEDQLAATVVSSRAQGLAHLCTELMAAFAAEPRLAKFRRVLDEGRARETA
jgi:hypothetical protein